MTSERLLPSFEYHLAAKGLADGTIRLYRYHLERFARALGRPLAGAQRVDIEVYLARSMADGWTGESARCALRAMRAWYKWLLAERLVDDDPTVRVARPRVVEAPVTVATEADVKALLAVCRAIPRESTATRDAALICVLASTGMRRSEVAAMRVADVDLDARTVEVPKSKNGKPRTVPLDRRAVEALAAYEVSRARHTFADLDAYWLGDDGALTSAGVRQVIRRRAAQAGVEVSSHSFRRGYAVKWLGAGGSQVGLQRVAGWSSPQMVARYTRMNGEALALDEARRLFG